MKRYVSKFLVWRFVLLTLACSPLVRPASAQQAASASQYPTLAALENAVIPARDRVDLARRIYGVSGIPVPPLSASTRQVGDQQAFWVSDLTNDRTFQVNATLRVVGEHIYLWVENGAPVSDAELQTLAGAFDARIYDPVRELWGSENTPGIDGDPRIYGLFAYGIGGATAAYFTTQNIYPAQVVRTSNEHEMLIFNLDGVSSYIPELESTTAHEFQHMIRSHVDGDEDTWLDEGFSVFTERYLGYSTPAGFALSFLNAPGTQLNAWSENGPRAPHYGAAFMFVTYFYERYGLGALQALSQHPANGLQSVDHVLRSLNAPGVNDLFADWVLANFLLDPDIEDGRYGYRMLWDGLPSANPRMTVAAYPYVASGSIDQYAADYYVFTNLRGKSALDISLALPPSVQLVPVNAASGRWMWYSNRGDESDTTLSRAFDLSSVTSATLTYRTWYHLERLWDYAYVMVSADGGATWTPLPAPRASHENPHDTAYGPGYTGESGGWIQETISLDAYAGREILLRFEMITDDATNQPGMVIDDVAIPEIGYFSDFEADGGGWEARGWVRTDNILPQQAWVQAVQQTGRDASITRWLAPADGGWTLPLGESADQVVLVVSPFAPVTTVPTTYTLNVTAR